MIFFHIYKDQRILFCNIRNFNINDVVMILLFDKLILNNLVSGFSVPGEHSETMYLGVIIKTVLISTTVFLNLT